MVRSQLGRNFRASKLVRVVLALLAFLSCFPAAAQSDPRWGMLTEVVERDFTVGGYPTTVRWIEPGESIKLTMIAVFGSVSADFRYDGPSGKMLYSVDGNPKGEPVTILPSGELTKDDGSRLVWKEDGVVRFALVKGKKYKFEPLKPGWLTKMRDGEVRKGRIRAADLSLNDRFSASSVAVQTPVQSASTVALPSSVPPVAINSGPRLALIIGNSAYAASLGALPNPANDAGAMAKALGALGFQVTLVKNADQRAMKRAISDFGQRLAKAGPGTTGLFFYAGHGIQAKGINYLIPTDANIQTQADVDLEAVGADTVLEQMEEAGAATNIVILDACRNMPLVRGFRSPTRGLAPMDAPNGSFIAYSTAPGSVAADGLGANSPFVTALVRNLGRKGESIESIFRDVRREVLTTTEGTQTPWDSSSLIQPFYFAGR